MIIYDFMSSSQYPTQFSSLSGISTIVIQSVSVSFLQQSRETYTSSTHHVCIMHASHEEFVIVVSFNQQICKGSIVLRGPTPALFGPCRRFVPPLVTGRAPVPVTGRPVTATRHYDGTSRHLLLTGHAGPI